MAGACASKRAPIERKSVHRPGIWRSDGGVGSSEGFHDGRGGHPRAGNPPVRCLAVCLQGTLIPPLRSRKARWLLALLVLRRGRPVERDWLAGLLWPESSQSRALYSLRRRLTDLRRALGDQAARLRAPSPRTLAFDL